MSVSNYIELLCKKIEKIESIFLFGDIKAKKTYT